MLRNSKINFKGYTLIADPGGRCNLLVATCNLLVGICNMLVDMYYLINTLSENIRETMIGTLQC